MKTPKIHSRSFHHRIKDGNSHYFDENHFMGIDPLDHARFHEIYEHKKEFIKDDKSDKDLAE